MRIVIMADGKASRWAEHLQKPKHMAPVHGEPLIQRTVRQLLELVSKLKKADWEIIITSHDARYEFQGCKRYEPQNNQYEIDRFTEELITDDMCYLYGDTYYTDEALRKIFLCENEETVFFGNKKSIVAIRIQNGECFREHKNRVKKLFLDGKLQECKGWQVYQSYTGQDLREKPKIDADFVLLDDETTDINTKEEYQELL